MSDLHATPAAQAGASNWKIITAIALGVGVIVMIGLVMLFRWGSDIFTAQVVKDIEDNPVILEHIGLITEIELDLGATSNEPGQYVFVFIITGSKGQGRLVAESITKDADTEEVTWGELRTESGETYPLFENQGPKPE